MDTLYLTESREDIMRAARIVKEGGLVAFPTETVYGLGGNALNPAASKKIYEAKGRPGDNPLIVHIRRREDVLLCAAEFPENAALLAKELWPGPLTMVLPKKEIVPLQTTGGLDTVALRMPANDAALRFIELAGVPIAAPSANLSGRPSPTMWEHVKQDMDGRIDAVIMGRPCLGGIESTVLDMTDPMRPMILRPGLIGPGRIEEILGLCCGHDPALEPGGSAAGAPRAPGMKYKHYAPRAEMLIFKGSPAAAGKAMALEAGRLEAQGKKAALLSYGDGKEAAKRLFADLRRLDGEGTDVILAAALNDEDPVNYSVMNRMMKAAGYKIKEV